MSAFLFQWGKCNASITVDHIQGPFFTIHGQSQPHVENFMTSEHTDMATSHAGEGKIVHMKLISANACGWFPFILDLKFGVT